MRRTSLVWVVGGVALLLVGLADAVADVPRRRAGDHPAPVRLFVMFGTEFRQLQDAYPEIADRIALAMKERVGDGPPDEPERLRIGPSRSGS